MSHFEQSMGHMRKASGMTHSVHMVVLLISIQAMWYLFNTFIFRPVKSNKNLNYYTSSPHIENQEKAGLNDGY